VQVFFTPPHPTSIRVLTLSQFIVLHHCADHFSFFLSLHFFTLPIFSRRVEVFAQSSRLLSFTQNSECFACEDLDRLQERQSERVKGIAMGGNE